MKDQAGFHDKMNAKLIKYKQDYELDHIDIAEELLWQLDIHWPLAIQEVRNTGQKPMIPQAAMPGKNY